MIISQKASDRKHDLHMPEKDGLCGTIEKLSFRSLYTILLDRQLFPGPERMFLTMK